jgi:hypothetical protein
MRWKCRRTVLKIKRNCRNTLAACSLNAGALAGE